MKKNILMLAFIYACTYSNAKTLSSTPTIPTYIATYSKIAQQESYRSNIPASIILAQAILESGFGNSNLSLKSNNHFGIKWHNSNDGNFVYAWDDDYNKKGNHIPSKFIKYSSVLESFKHHSDFIMKRNNYKRLFKYDRTDYFNWAHGLKERGYCTDSDYALQLIKLIKKYNLYNYDVQQPIMAVNNKYKPTQENIVKEKAIKITTHIDVKTNGILQYLKVYKQDIDQLFTPTKSVDTLLETANTIGNISLNKNSHLAFLNLEDDPGESTIMHVDCENRFKSDEQTPQYFW